MHRWNFNVSLAVILFQTGGFVDVVRYLVESGADINERSHNGTGGNALFYAWNHNGENHPVYLYLESLGAVKIEPDPEL
jgi:hypothetical protein